MRFILTLLIALFCAPHPAAAAAPREFYGVISADGPRPDRTRPDGRRRGGNPPDQSRLGSGRVRSGRPVRLEPLRHPDRRGRGPGNPRAADGVQLAALGGGAGFLSAIAGARWGDYSRFARAAAARYGSQGSFWSEHPEIPRLPVTDWQLWNEPNLQGFWRPKLSAKSYVGLLRVFSRAMRSGDPDAHVLLAGLFPSPTAHGHVIGIPLERYLSTIYRQKNAKNAVRRRRHPSVRHHPVPRPGRREARPRDHEPLPGPEDADLARRGRLDDRRRPEPADGPPGAAGRLPDPDLPAARRQPASATRSRA